MPHRLSDEAANPTRAGDPHPVASQPVVFEMPTQFVKGTAPESASDSSDSNSEYDSDESTTDESDSDESAVEESFRHVPGKADLASQPSPRSSLLAAQGQSTRALDSHASQQPPVSRLRWRTMQSNSTSGNSLKSSGQGLLTATELTESLRELQLGSDLQGPTSDDISASKTSTPAPCASSSVGQNPILKSALAPPSLSAKKQTTFAKIVAAHRASHSDQSDDDDESAIDDDDSDSDWEDTQEESRESSVADPIVFRRISSMPNLASGKSLISLLFESQGQRTAVRNSHASQQSPASPEPSRKKQQKSTSGSPSHDSDEGLQMMEIKREPTQTTTINKVPRSTSQPIRTRARPSRHGAPALSPRTTRRTMLAIELTESVRRGLLWERHQKTRTANAVLKRRHSSDNPSDGASDLPQQLEGTHLDSASSQDKTADAGLKRRHTLDKVDGLRTSSKKIDSEDSEESDEEKAYFNRHGRYHTFGW